jgi:pyridoxamine 5'-phosphate oxidase
MCVVDLDQLRNDLVSEGLPDELSARDPVELAQSWVTLAREAALFNPDAMAVASVDPDGRPSVRNVLMRGVIDGGFSFYTNYDSQKGVELTARHHVEALFSWLVLERQIRVRGHVERLSSGDSDAYFDARPRASKLAAHASDQSRPIPSRQWLDKRYDEVVAEYDGRDVERPEHWGGFRIIPERIEFWQGHPNRLHNRLVFTRADAGWATSRLAP